MYSLQRSRHFDIIFYFLFFILTGCRRSRSDPHVVHVHVVDILYVATASHQFFIVFGLFGSLLIIDLQESVLDVLYTDP